VEAEDKDPNDRGLIPTKPREERLVFLYQPQ